MSRAPCDERSNGLPLIALRNAHQGTRTLVIKSGESMVFSAAAYVFSLRWFRDAGYHGALVFTKVGPENRSSIDSVLARLILLVALRGHHISLK